MTGTKFDAIYVSNYLLTMASDGVYCGKHKVENISNTSRVISQCRGADDCVEIRFWEYFLDSQN